MTNALYMLLGAAFVAIGVLAAALADRIRGLRISRDAAPRDRGDRAPSVPAQPARAAIPVVDHAELHRATPPKQPRPPRAEPKVVASSEGGDDVISALVAAGFKKPVATEATWACTAAERATVEIWTATALRRCARGGMS